jgi:hypothetical protein
VLCGFEGRGGVWYSVASASASAGCQMCLAFGRSVGRVDRWRGEAERRDEVREDGDGWGVAYAAVVGEG